MRVVKLSVRERPTHTIAEIDVPHSRSTHIQLSFRAGSRYETAAENGLAHFLEHIVFKGSELYPSYEAIRDQTNNLGARLNAWTNLEGINFHVTVRKELAREAAALLTDMIARPLIRPEDVITERGVITQELEGALDRPANRIAYALAESYYGSHPLSRKILGERETIQSFTSEDLRSYRSRYLHHPLITVAGNLDHLDAEEIAGAFELRDGTAPLTIAPKTPVETFCRIVREESNQTHLRIAIPILGGETDMRQRAALATWQTALSQKLFSEIREKRGLCYSISSSIGIYHDRSRLWISAGLERDKAAEAYRAILDLTHEMRESGLSDDVFQQVISKRYGEKILGYESTPNLGEIVSRSWIDLREITDPEETLNVLDLLTREEVNESPAGLAGSHLIAALGPHTEEEFLPSL